MSQVSAKIESFWTSLSCVRSRLIPVWNGASIESWISSSDPLLSVKVMLYCLLSGNRYRAGVSFGNFAIQDPLTMVVRHSIKASNPMPSPCLCFTFLPWLEQLRPELCACFNWLWQGFVNQLFSILLSLDTRSCVPLGSNLSGAIFFNFCGSI